MKIFKNPKIQTALKLALLNFTKSPCRKHQKQVTLHKRKIQKDTKIKKGNNKEKRK